MHHADIQISYLLARRRCTISEVLYSINITWQVYYCDGFVIVKDALCSTFHMSTTEIMVQQAWNSRQMQGAELRRLHCSLGHAHFH